MNKKLSSIQRIPVYRFYLGMFILVALCVLIFALSYNAGGASRFPAASPDVSPAEPVQTDAVPNLPQTDSSASPTTAIP